MTTAPTRPAPSTAALACARAAESAATCAAECLGLRQLHDRGRCSDSCLLAARTLGACADLLGSVPHELHSDLMLAIARAGIIAAEGCAIECTLQADEIEAAAAASDACRIAANELRSLADQLARLVGEAAPLDGVVHAAGRAALTVAPA